MFLLRKKRVECAVSRLCEKLDDSIRGRRPGIRSLKFREQYNEVVAKLELLGFEPVKYGTISETIASWNSSGLVMVAALPGQPRTSRRSFYLSDLNIKQYQILS